MGSSYSENCELVYCLLFFSVITFSFVYINVGCASLMVNGSLIIILSSFKVKCLPYTTHKIRKKEKSLLNIC